MKRVRDYIEGLIRSRAIGSGRRSTFRISIPKTSSFEADGAVFTYPATPPQETHRAGGVLEQNFVLEWIDPRSVSGSYTLEDNDLAVDLTAVLGFASGRKVAFANELPISVEGQDLITFIPLGIRLDSELYGPADDGVNARMDKVFKALVTLPQKKAIAIGDAIRMRNAACNLAEQDYSSAYGLLVAALETLSGEFGENSSVWEDWDLAGEWDAFIAEQGLSHDQAAALRDRLFLDKQIRIGEKFVDYTISSLDETFWDQHYWEYVPTIEIVHGHGASANWLPENFAWQDAGTLGDRVPQRLSDLRKRLTKTYNARSQVFHRSVRLQQIILMGVGGAGQSLSDPLPFSGLRRIVDCILWKEIERGLLGARSVPHYTRIRPTP